MESATITELRQRPVTPPTGGWPEGTGEIAIATATETTMTAEVTK